jgi:hypothetical protein
MKQEAPDPTDLFELVEACRYRSGWTVRLEDLQRDEDHGRGVAGGLTLIITTATTDSYHPERHIRVAHYFIVPAATYDRRSWRRWLFERFRDVESHECAEFFQVGDERPYAPSHGPGNDPYLIREVGTDIDQRTSFRGEIKRSNA